MPDLKLRPAELADLPTLLRFEQGVIEAERPLIRNMKDSNIKYYDIEKLIDDENSQLIVAEINQHLVGSGYARIEPAKAYLKHENLAYLGFMYVEPESRGLGVVQKILVELITWSKTQKVGEIILEVYEGNDAAIRAYEKAGFHTYVRTMRLCDVQLETSD